MLKSIQKIGGSMTRKIVRTIDDYPYQVAGKTWKIPHVQIEKSETGSEVLSGKEVTRMNEFVANAICSKYNELTGEELDFLCDITATKYTEVALKIGLTKSIVSKWVAKEKENISFAHSIILKKYFWIKIFGTVNLGTIEPILAFDDEKLFNYMKTRIAS